MLRKVIKEEWHDRDIKRITTTDYTDVLAIEFETDEGVLLISKKDIVCLLKWFLEEGVV